MKFRLVSRNWIFTLFGLLLLQVGPANAQWTRKQDASYKRGEMASVLYNNKIYLFTGFGEWPYVQPTNEMYDPATNTWTALAPIPDGQTATHQGIALVGDKVWCIGGRLTDTHGTLTSNVWIYDISRDQWSAGPSLIDPANGQPLLWGGGGAALVGRTLHVFGGFINDPCNNDQDKYHLSLDVDAWLADPQHTTWQNKLTPMPIKRNHVSTTVYKGKIYVVGGQFGHDCGGGQDQRYSHMYDPLTDTWTRLTDLPTVRSHCEASIFAIDGKIYISGGDGATNRITVLSPDANGGLGSWANAAYNLPVNPYTNTNNYIGVAARVIGDSFIVACGKIGDTDPRRETYTTPFTRNSIYKLGFGADCFARTLEPDQKTVVKNLLYTIDGEKTYQLSSDAAWLTITKNATGTALPTAVEVEATIDATGLAPGNYTATVTATGTGGGSNYTGSSFCVNLKVTTDVNAQPSILVNAGGRQYTDGVGRVWSADTYYSGGVTSSKSFNVAGTTDDALYLSYRFASSGAPFSYNVPVSEAGAYTVTLHLMEPYFTKAGARSFNVDLEGQRVLSSYDIYAQQGYGRAVVLTYQGISVSDGTLNILFTSVINNAVVSGIEVEKGSSAVTYTLAVNTTGSGSVSKSPNQSTYSSGAIVQLTATPAAGSQFTGWSGDVSGTTNPVSITMDGDKVVTANFETVSTSGTVLVNAGGGQYTDGAGRSWSADTYFSGGVTSSKSFDVAGTSDDPLYLRYRFASSGAPFSYNIPVSEAGAYTVTLYLMEPYFKKAGARSFNLDLEGQRVLSSYDIYAQQGYGRAVALTYQGISVSDGTLNILFTSVINNAVVSGIEVSKSAAATNAAAITLAQATAPATDNLRQSMAVYPNPATDGKVFIETAGFSKEEALTVALYDVTGRVLHTVVIRSDEHGTARTALQLKERLPRGMYVVQAQGATHKVQSRLLVQ